MTVCELVAKIAVLDPDAGLNGILPSSQSAGSFQFVEPWLR
jgi:hypothetical protein